jgi:cytochrome c
MGGITVGKRTVLVLVLLVFACSFTLAFAKNHTAEERGKAHFNNKTFAGGKKACSTCHPNGRGLEAAGTEVINVCVVNANKGNALDVNSVEMQEMTAYIKSLGGQ